MKSIRYCDRVWSRDYLRTSMQTLSRKLNSAFQTEKNLLPCSQAKYIMHVMQGVPLEFIREPIQPKQREAANSCRIDYSLIKHQEECKY